MSARSNINRAQFPPSPPSDAYPKDHTYEHDVRMTSLNAEIDGGVPADDPAQAPIRDLLRGPGAISDHGTWYYPSGGGEKQGKLFHDPKPVDEHRWPRGYNPERQQQARHVTKAFSGDENTIDNEGVFDRQQFWARDTVARSSAPLTDLYTEQPSQWSKEPYARPFIEDFEITEQEWDHPEYPDDADRHGFWDSRQKKLSVNKALSRQPEQTLMHELGHAASSAAGTGRKYSTPESIGAEEGRADAYMAQHWVPGKHTKERPRTYDYPPRDWQAQGDPEAFARAYVDEHRARGIGTPSERADQEVDHDAEFKRRKVYRQDSRLFEGYDTQESNKSRDRLGLYYGHDRHHTSLPDDPWEADRDQGDEVMSMETISTPGVPAKEIINNRQRTGRIRHEDISRVRSSPA